MTNTELDTTEMIENLTTALSEAINQLELMGVNTDSITKIARGE